jgi:hypothetical protein
METKVCTKCNVEKSLDEFVKRSDSPNGYRPNCKICMNQRVKDWRENNVDRVKETSKTYRKNNYSNIRKKQKEWEDENREKNREKARIKVGIWRKNNPNKVKEIYTNWRKNNPNKVKEGKKIQKQKIKTKLYNSVRERIRIFLKIKNITKKNKTFEIVGCTPDFLKKHLERQFKDNMTWDNYGFYGWHIDHIIPLSSAKTEEEIYKLCNYTNLQPLWAEENMKKSNKLNLN